MSNLKNDHLEEVLRSALPSFIAFLKFSTGFVTLIAIGLFTLSLFRLSP